MKKRMTMPLEIVTVPCLSDNYAFLLHDAASGRTALVDAPDPAAVTAALKKRGWGLDEILLTHHHWDHIDGTEALRSAFGASVTGAEADAHRLPDLNRAVKDGESFDLFGHEVQVLDVSGHTVGHIAFYIPDSNAVFTADSLMALGCGRLFEGTPEQMWNSLSRLAALPPETVVYSGHEYTQANAAFAITIDPGNDALKTRIAQIDTARAAGEPTVPSTLQLELDTNPFLRAHLSSVKESMAMQNAEDVDVFTEIRRRKDNF